jgi:hypothetical protein
VIVALDDVAVAATVDGEAAELPLTGDEMLTVTVDVVGGGGGGVLVFVSNRIGF